MSEFQNKVSGSLNKIQDPLQQGKQKIQTVQDISQIEQTLSVLHQKRQELIVLMGNKIHKKLRLNEIIDTDFHEITTNIEVIDKNIYQQAKAVDQLKASTQNLYICISCDSEVNPSDKFCGSCGTPVIIPETVKEELKNCQECEEEIPHSALFCPCCGYSTVAIQEGSYVL